MEELMSRYALALFEIAKEKNNIEVYQLEIKQLIEILNENNEFIDLLSSNLLDKKDIHLIIDNTFKSFSQDIINLIHVVIDNNRGLFLLEILNCFNSLCNKYFNIVEGLVYSVNFLSKEELNDIEEVISKKENIKVQLVNKIDTSLIGGIKVVVNDHVFDGSIKNRIFNMKQSLLNGSN